MSDTIPPEAPKSLRGVPAATAESKTIEAWQLELATPDEEHQPTRAYHRWPIGFVLTRAAYEAAIAKAMGLSFSSPTRS